MLNRVKYLLLYVASSLILAGCGGGSSGDSSGSSNTSYIFDDNEKTFLYNLFLTEYYWSDHVSPALDVSGYTQPQAMIDGLRYSAIDRWSFVLTQEQYNNIAKLQRVGFGLELGSDFSINLVHENSPANSVGLQRGDRIVSINDQPPSKSLIAKLRENTSQPTKFTIKRDGEIKDITASAQSYGYTAASYSIVQSPAGHSVGYLYLYDFSESAVGQIESAFNYFKAQNIDKLVIDLRYNGGGSINTASILLDKVGRNFNGLPQFTLQWNAQSSAQNETLYFDSLDPNSLSLSKLVFLTTADSASASEAVINAMKPYMLGNTAIVGSRTHGKPVGMTGRTNGSYIYFLINFVIANSVGFYDYYDGLPADCNVPDSDYGHQLGDPNEALLKEALYYIDNNHC